MTRIEENKMKINIPIEMEITKKNKNFICGDLTTLSMLMGTKSVSGNFHLYNIKKDGKNYIVPIKIVEERRDKIREAIRDYEKKLGVIEQFLKKKK